MATHKRRRIDLSAKVLHELEAKHRTKPLDTALSEFLDYCGAINLSDATIRNYHYSIRNVIQTLTKLSIDTGDLKAVTVADIQTLTTHYLATKHKPSTINMKLRCLSVLYEWAIKRDYATENVIKKHGYLRETHVQGDVLTADEVARILHVTKPVDFITLRDYAMISTALYTGLRAKELVSLDVDNADLVAGVLRVKTTKNKRQRNIPIAKPLMNTLRLYVTERGHIEDCTALFVTQDNNRMTVRTYQARLERVGEVAGVHVTSHGLRRTTASVLMRAGVSPYVVMEILGHSDLSQLRKYVALDDTTLRQAVNNIDFEAR